VESLVGLKLLAEEKMDPFFGEVGTSTWK
jgi:hypothetical protein